MHDGTCMTWSERFPRQMCYLTVGEVPLGCPYLRYHHSNQVHRPLHTASNADAQRETNFDLQAVAPALGRRKQIRQSMSSIINQKVMINIVEESSFAHVSSTDGHHNLTMAMQGTTLDAVTQRTV